MNFLHLSISEGLDGGIIVGPNAALSQLRLSVRLPPSRLPSLAIDRGIFW